MSNKSNKSDIFVTSDQHFGHKNIIRFSNRPYRDVNHMNEEMIKNWNAIISDNDDVYMLGDVSLTNAEKTKDIIYRLNGRLHLINGNHEKSVLSKSYNRDRFEWIKDYYELKINDEGEKAMFVMCHYAFRVWNKSHHKSIHLYGHSHDSLDANGEFWGRSMDVGVDSAARVLGEYRPFRLSEITNIMKKREPKIIDHHGK